MQKKIIIIPHGTKGRMAAELGVGLRTIDKALQYGDKGSPTCKRIREAALREYSGKHTIINI